MTTNELGRPIDERLAEAGFSELTEAGIKRNDRKWLAHNEQLSAYQTESSDYYDIEEDFSVDFIDHRACERDLQLLDFRDFLWICDKAGVNTTVAIDWYIDRSLREIAADIGCSKSQARNEVTAFLESASYWLGKHPYWGLADVLREIFKTDYEERVVIR